MFRFLGIISLSLLVTNCYKTYDGYKVCINYLSLINLNQEKMKRKKYAKAVSLHFSHEKITPYQFNNF